MDSDVRAAIEAVAEALGLLRTAPDSAAVVAAVDQAVAAVEALPLDVTSTALRRLVTHIEQFHCAAGPAQ